MVQPRKTCPCLTERLLMGRKDSNQTNKQTTSLDPDQARHFVRPDLGPNCSQMLSADIAGKELNTYYFLAEVNFIWLQLFPFG